MNAGVYLRVSKEDKHEEKVSIDQQLDDAHRLAATVGLKIDPNNIYEDVNLTGGLYPAQWLSQDPVKRRKYRPGFTKLIDAIKNGSIQAVIVRKRNRLMRGLKQHVLFYELLKDRNVKLYCTHEQSFDSKDASSELSTNLLAIIAEHQLKETSEHIKATKAYQIRHGLKHGPAFTYGYTDGIDENGRKAHVLEPHHVNIVKQIFEWFNSGIHKSKIVRMLNEQYPNAEDRSTLSMQGRASDKWQFHQVRRILTNPRYIGFEDMAMKTPSAYPAFLTQEVFFHSQVKHLENEQYNRGSIRLLSGFIYCGKCNRRMIAQHVTCEKPGPFYRYYCKHHFNIDKAPPNIREHHYLDMVETFFSWQLIRTKPQQADPKIKERLLTQQSSIGRNMKVLKKSMTEGKIEATDFLEVYNKLQNNLKEVTAKIEQLESNEHIELFNWETASLDERRRWLTQHQFHIVVFMDHVLASFTPMYSNQKITLKIPIFKQKIKSHYNWVLVPRRLNEKEIYRVLFDGKGKIDPSVPNEVDYTKLPLTTE